MADCVDPAGMFAAYRQAAARLDERGTTRARPGERPPGRLRHASTPPSWAGCKAAIASPMYLRAHDPDGRPRALRRRDRF